MGNTQHDLRLILTRMQEKAGDPALSSFVVLCQRDPNHTTRALYYEGVLHVLCQPCDKIIMEFAVAP